MSERFLGIQIEYPQTDKKALRGIVFLSTIYRVLARFQMYGELPEEGPAIIVANHTSMTDVLKIAHLSFTTSRRVIRAVARKDLLILGYKESEEVLERTGKKGKFNILRLPLVSKIMASMFSGVGAIPIVRGGERTKEENEQFLHTCDEILASGQMLGIFIQETRIKEGDLRNPMPGIGLLARIHRDVPVIPVTVLNSRFGNRVIVGEQLSYSQDGRGLNARQFTALIGDRLAQNHVDSVRFKWETEDKPLLLRKAS